MLLRICSLISPIDGGSVFVARSTDDVNINESLYFLPPRDGVYGDYNDAGTFVEGSSLNSGLIKYTEDYTVPIDLSLGSGGSADLSDITMHLIPAQTNNYNIGSEAFDPDAEDPNNALEIRAFKDVFIQGDYKYWNATTNQFDNLNSASIPYHESILNITPKVSNFTVDESYFTIIDESFDTIGHKEFIRARFDYNPYTGEEASTTLDIDNIYETSDTVNIVEDFSHSEDFTIIETIDSLGTSDKETIYETLESVPSSVWNPVNFDGSPIIIPDPGNGIVGHFINNPEEIILWSSIKIPQDFSNWISTNPFNIKLRATEKENVKVTTTIYDVDKLKTYEIVHNYNDLSENFVEYNLVDLGEVTENWLQGQEFTLKIFIQ